MNMGLIYKLTCIKNGYFIYGSTINLRKRKTSYLSYLRRNAYKNDILQNSYNKYGKESLHWEIVQDNIPEDILECVEDIWIGANCARVEDRKGGMNMRDAQRSRYSEEIIEKIRMLGIDRFPSEETILKMSESQKALNRKKKKDKIKKDLDVSIYTNKKRIKTSKCIPIVLLDNNGKFINEFSSMRECAIYLKVSESCIGSALKNKKNQKSVKNHIVLYKKDYDPNKDYIYRNSCNKIVEQYDKNNNFIKQYDSATEAAKQNNFCQGHISACCRGERKRHRGFIWKYKQ